MLKQVQHDELWFGRYAGNIRLLRGSMRHLLPIAVAIILPAPLQAQPAAPPVVAAASADAQLAGFFDTQDKAQLARSPQSQSYRGIRTDYGKWNDGSDAAAIAAHDADMTALADMRARFANVGLSPASKLSYRLFEKAMARRDAAFRYRNNGYVFSQMYGAQSEYPAFLINVHGVREKADAQAYVSRLRGIGAALDTGVALSEARAKAGVLPPKWVYPFVLSAPVLRKLEFINTLIHHG